MYNREPLFHSEITDDLDDNHPLVHEQVEYLNCKKLVHAFNNENMDSWMETGLGALCLPCFYTAVEEKGAQMFYLPPEGKSRPSDETWANYNP